MESLTQLTELGFTEYEAKVYLALLEEAPASGYQISKRAGVPRSMVYEALGRLKARRAVLETSDERAALYRPVPPDVLLDTHQAAQQRLVDQLRLGLNTLYHTRDEDLVWAIRGRDMLLSYAAELIRQARREVYLVLDDPEVDALQAEIVAAAARGVDVSAVLTGEQTLPCGQIVHHPPLESELHQLAGALIVVVDGQETLIATTNGREMSATVTRNAHLVLITRQFVWMELFAQRIFARLGPEGLSRLDAPDRAVLESTAANSQTPVLA